VGSDEDEEGEGNDPDVKGVEAPEGCGGYSVAAPEPFRDISADKGNVFGRLCGNGGRPVGQLRPREQVTAERGSEPGPEKDDPGHPLKLARFLVSAHREGAKHMKE